MYVAVVSIYLYLMPVEQIASSELVMADVTRLLFGEKGKALVVLLILITALGSMNGTLITGSRVSYAWLTDLLPSKSSGKLLNGSIWLVGILSLLLILWGTFEKLLYFTGFFVWFFFGLAGFSLFIFRRQDQSFSGFKVPLYPLIPIMFIFICLVLIINTFDSYMTQSLTGLFLLLLGIPIYLFLQKRKNK